MATLSVHSYSPRKRSVSSSYHATETDLQLYRRLTLDLGVPPNSEMLRYVGPQADHLVFIGESGTSEWARFLRQVYTRWPDLPVGGPVAEDGTVLDSLPERLAYEQLLPLMVRGLQLDLHQPISPEDGDYRADLTIRFKRSAAYLEVVGACGSDRIVRNPLEEEWLDRLDRRLDFYAELGIEPMCLYLDHLMDLDGLQQEYRRVIASLRRREARS